MRLASRLFLCSALVLSVAVLHSRGDSQKWEFPRFSTDAEGLYKAASGVTAPAGSDILVLDEESSFVFDAEGKSVHQGYILYKVLTQHGAEEWNNLALHYAPWHQERPVIRARVITSDNEIHPLDPKTLTDGPANADDPDVYSDRLVVRAPLPAIAPGSLVEEEETTADTKSYFSAGTVNRFFFGSIEIPTHYSRFVIDAPASLPLQYRSQLLPDLNPERKEENGRVQIVFERGEIPALEKVEDHLPSDAPTYPNVSFSTGASWRQVAEEYAKTVDTQIAMSDVKALTSKVITGKKTLEEKATAILEYVDREVRYTGVEFGEAALTPRSPAETLQRKYGDCKDKATLVVAMLRAAGVPSNVVLLNVGENQDMPSDLPGISLFDHAIVHLAEGPGMWLDPTDEHARLGQLPYVDQGRLALIAGDKSESLVRTPVATSQDNLIVEKREFFLAENGPARVVETSEPHGETESRYRSSYADTGNKDRTKELADYMKAQYLAEKLDRFETSNPTDISKQFTLVLESKTAKRGATDLETAVVAIRLESIFGRLPVELQQREKAGDKKAETDQDRPTKFRTVDYQLSEAFATEWQYSVFPPAGFRPKPLPPNAKISVGPAVLTKEFSAEKDGVVHATIRFDTIKRRLSASEAHEIADKVSDLREGPAILIYFEPVAQALLNEGKVKESFQAYRDLIALHPNEAVHHLQIAQALLGAGMGQAARDEAHLAVKLQPASPLAQKTLAEILEYDLVGRKLRPGSDYVGAEAAFREAQRLDPDDKAIRANLAIFLEYNHDGERYAPDSRMKESVAEYKTLTAEQLDEVGLKNNPAYALFYAHEFPEARKYAESLNPQPSVVIVASEAAMNGAAAGIAEAGKRSTSEEDRKSTLKSAGEMLMRARVYPPAADLMEAGASGENTSNTMGLAALLRKARPYEDLHYSDDPTGAAMQSFVLIASPGLNLEKLRTVYNSRNAREVIARMDEDQLDQTFRQARGLRYRLSRAGYPADVMLDVTMQSIEPKVEGDDTSGYRVTLRVPNIRTQTIYVVKEGGKYKILEISPGTDCIALEILDRIATNNLAGARVLLDWLRDQQHLAGGDDPLAGFVFPRIWTKGMDADAARMKIAAASILVQMKPTAPQGVKILEAARSAATNEADKLNISLALLMGYRFMDAFDKILDISTEIAKQYPESITNFRDEMFALRGLRKFKEANALAQDRMNRIPDDIEAQRAFLNTAVSAEEYSRVRESAVKLAQNTKAEASDFNFLAWNALFTGKVESEDIAYAIKAVQLDQNDMAALHTLGCIYAEIGKTKEAREILIQAMDGLNLDEPQSAYWYAFGRIAEQDGEMDVAKADYARVARPQREIDLPDSSYRLAQNRLTILANAQPASGRLKK
jgi:Flp pilus assembly protein TadD